MKVPHNVNIKTLKNDVKNGAAPYKEVFSLLQEKNEVKYIVITAKSLEMAYMAIMYLDAGFYPNTEQEHDEQSLALIIKYVLYQKI